jgi:hypothetical protein
VNKSSIIFVLLVFVFRGLLEISYINVINPVFSYAGFYVNYSYNNYFISWIIFLSGFLFSASRILRVSDYFFIVTFLVIITPMCILYGYDTERSFVPLGVSVGALSIIYFVVNTKSISFRTLPIFKSGLHLVVLVSSLFVLFLILWYTLSGVSLNFNLMEVYDFRSKNRDLAGGRILNYTNGWTYNVFNMTLFAIALLARRYVIAVFIFAVQVYFFAASAHKSVLFIPFIILSLFFYFRTTERAAFIPALFSLIVFLTLSSYYLMGDTLASSILVRRIFFIPSSLTFTYFEFFNDNPKVMWSNSVLSSFLEYPYDQGQSMSNVIGNFLGYPEMAANNGFISSGYAHAGLFGVFFYSLILGFILRFLNHITNNLVPLWFALSLCVAPLSSLIISSDLFTVLLTHGFIVALLIIFLVRSKIYANTPS